MLNNFCLYFFGILLIVSALLYTTEWLIVPYLYALGGGGVAVLFLVNPYRGDNFRLKRLNIQQAIAALMLPVSAYFMFKGMGEWIVCLLSSAILQTYVVFIRDYEDNKNNHGNH